MSKEKEQVYTAKGLKDYLIERFKTKKTLEPFTPQDTQNYIRRGYLPKYLGDIKIKESKGVRGIRTFKLIENDKSKV